MASTGRVIWLLRDVLYLLQCRLVLPVFAVHFLLHKSFLLLATYFFLSSLFSSLLSSPLSLSIHSLFPLSSVCLSQKVSQHFTTFIENVERHRFFFFLLSILFSSKLMFMICFYTFQICLSSERIKFNHNLYTYFS